jgi:RHS repeat-associated protein
MKKLFLLLLGLLAVLSVGRAQTNSNPGRLQVISLVAPLTPGTNFLTVTNGGSNVSQSPSAIAEAITPDIQVLAGNLENDPTQIFNYVHDHIRHVLYFGSKKGAELTLLERSGNDFDQCALLSALLQAAGYSPGYQFGLMAIPYDSTNHLDLHHWLGLSLVNTNWTNTYQYLGNLFSDRGFAVWDHEGDNNTMVVQRIWVTLAVGTNSYCLDPAFKISEPVTNIINLASAMSFSSNSLWTAAGGTSTANYVQNLTESTLRSTLSGYNSNLLAYLSNNAPTATVQQIIGGQRIVSSTGLPLSTTNLFPTVTSALSHSFPISSWTYQPTNFMATLSVGVGGTNQMWLMPQLQGQRLSLTFSNNGTAQLWLDDSQVFQTTNTGSGEYTTVSLGVTFPYNQWDITHNIPIDSLEFDRTVNTSNYQRTNSSYAITYAFEASPQWLQERQQQLDAYQSAGYASTSRQVTTETLNVMALNWMLQTELSDDLLAQQSGQLEQNHYRLGRMGQETGRGYYVDVYMELTGVFPATGIGTADFINDNQFFDVSTYLASAMEHGVIEQLQSSNIVAASTVKMIEIASTNSQPIYMANSANWSSVSGSLVGYNSSVTNALSSAIANGAILLLPQNGANQVNGAGSWSGDAYVQLVSNSSGRSMGMIIGGGYNGGYDSDPTATVNPGYVQQADQSQSTYVVPTSAFLSSSTAGDPINMADGTFQVDNVDLSLGQAAPRGISLERYYSTEFRNYNFAGMASGWLHNYYFKASLVSAPQPSLGTTTPQQMAPMLVATCAALNFYNNLSPTPKNWTVTALISKWAIDQIINNAVSVCMGKDTVQFIKQPDGSYTPPAGCSMTLAKNGSGYNLQQRHGNLFQFGANSSLTNIVDQYGRAMKFTYNASNQVSTITDWTNRSLTFNYTSGQLLSINDNSSPSRTVHYGYSGTNSAQADLTSFTDAEGKTSTYAYDTNHEIVATFDALTHMVSSNMYDGFGHVVVQFSQGDATKLWQIFASGFQTTVIDPAGGQQQYVYDDLSRQISFQDALGHVSQTFYDGQDQVVMSVSPLNETNQAIFDANHNVLYSVDPLGFTNQFVYDGNNNLIRSIDPRGNPSTFGYNAQFSLTGSTNGAGDFVNYAFNSDGTLHTRTDSSGTTTYGFDTYGQVNSITYPGSLGSESFVSSSLGDVTTHTDANGNVTAFSYNNRRQLTNAVAPTNLTVKVSFDAVGNVAATTDARGNVTSNTWSATRHLLATILPATPQGVPVVTNAYDSRDWPTKTVDPLLNPTLYTNDLAGRMISVTDPVLRTTTFGFDADGRKLAAVNAAQETNSQTWDARGSLLKFTDGAGHFSTRAYDAAGNQINLTNRNGKLWQFKFDTANRLTNSITPLGHSSSVTFNHQGLPATVKDAAGQTTSLYYDAKGRLTNRTDNVATTLYSFDANDNPKSVVENGLTNSWTYDAYNRVSTYRDVYGNLIQYHFDASGNLTNLVYPGGRNVYYAFDSLNRMTNVTDWSGRKTSIGYDLNSHVTSIVRPNGSYRTIAYDATGQATNILEQMANSLPIAWFRFNWTNSGNLGWEFGAPLPHTNAPPTRTMTYDIDNRLYSVDENTVSVDTNGNLTSGPLTNDTFATYAFDARNRLLNVGGVTNAYDAMNNRIGQTFGTNSSIFVVNPNAALPQVLMRIKNGITNYYIYGAGLLYQITETAAATNTLTYHFDYRGSTIALSADSGLVTDRIEYSAYGLMTYRAGTSDTPFLFNGRYGVMTDPNSLLYMRARYYNPFLCRFINADPSGFSGGLNFYAFANGNPVSLLDPFGMGALGEGLVMSSWVDTSQNSVPNASVTLPGSIYSDCPTISPSYSGPYLSQGNPNAQPYIASVSADPASYSAFSDIAGSQLTPEQAAMYAAPISMFLPLPGLGAADGTMATQEGLINISQHLAQGVDYGIEPANIAMYGRLTDAFEAGEPLTGIDANFYEHELIESSLVDAGMNPAAAHVAALNIQGIKNTAAAPAQLYQPNIILKYSESFNSAAHP